MLISHTVNLFSDHILVIGNTGSNSTKEALHATEQGFAVGMHASLQINPYYGKTSMPGGCLALGGEYNAHQRIRPVAPCDVEGSLFVTRKMRMRDSLYCPRRACEALCVSA